MTLDFRDATPGDALQVTRVHRRLREAYYTDALDPLDAAHDRFPTWADMLTRTDTWCLVAVQDGHLTGFVAARAPPSLRCGTGTTGPRASTRIGGLHLVSCAGAGRLSSSASLGGGAMSSR